MATEEQKCLIAILNCKQQHISSLFKLVVLLLIAAQNLCRDELLRLEKSSKQYSTRAPSLSYMFSSPSGNY